MQTTGAASGIRSVLGANLRLLLARGGSVSEVCRNIGINRTQFNRYLNSESFPGPDVLHKICTHFGVDARILLEPLPEQDGSVLMALREQADVSAIEAKAANIDHSRLPDGMYLSYYPIPSTQTGAIVSLVRIYSLSNGVKMMKAAFSSNATVGRGRSLPWPNRIVTGLFFQHVAGVSMIAAHHHNPMIYYSFYSYGFRGDDLFYPGVSLGTHHPGPGQKQFAPVMLVRITGGFAAGVAARRQCGRHDLMDLPTVPRAYFSTWVPA